MKDILVWISFGGLIAVGLMASADWLLNGYTKQGKDAISQCEAKLPRDRHCKITAVPVAKE